MSEASRDNRHKEKVKHFPANSHAPQTPTSNSILLQAQDDKSNINMEVHKHPHHVMHKKKWPEYLLEFFMLFLAVFLGFVAENVRENISDKHKEKNYIRSMIKDLKTDTSKIAANEKAYTSIINKLDTLMNSFDSIKNGFSGRIFFLFEEATNYYPDFIYTDGTIQQLKNAGGFRLIEKQNAIDSIMAYDAEVKRALINENSLLEDHKEVYQAKSELFSYRELSNTLQSAWQSGKNIQEIQSMRFNCVLADNSAAKDRIYNKLFYYRNLMITLKNENYKSVKQKATSLIDFLKKEYHLETE